MPAFLSTLFTNPLLSAWHLLMFGVAIAGLGFLIAIHEMGHFLFAKLFGISTPTFSIGFGPQLISKKIGETTFSLSAIPLGGYVEIAGLAEVGQGEQGEAGRTDKRSFASKPYWQKMLVMLGGIGVNLGFAYVACIGLSFVQSPLVTPAQLHVAPSEQLPEPLQDALAKANDKLTLVSITSFPAPHQEHTLTWKPNGSGPAALRQAMEFSSDIIEKTSSNDTLAVTFAGKDSDRLREGLVTYTINITRDELIHPDEKMFRFMQIKTATDNVGGLGWAIKNGIARTNTLIAGTAGLLVSAFRRRSTEEMGGPLMIIHMTKQGAAQGPSTFIFFLILISISLGVLNLLPLPILDGGQVLFQTIESVLGRPVPLRVREMIHIITWIIVLAFFVFVTIRDMRRIANGGGATGGKRNTSSG